MCRSPTGTWVLPFGTGFSQGRGGGGLVAARCSECGLSVDAGQPRCEELRDILLARDFQQPVLFWQYHRLAIDAYCVQHSSYVKSAKSLAAHLCGLCIYFDHQNDAAAMRTLQRWLSTNPQINKPELPAKRGQLTITHVSGIEDSVSYGCAVEQWARSAWDAYENLHVTAREWLKLSSRHKS
jgi:Family of unknown function (DUF5946)